jgi:hypothetical protein
MAWVISYLHAFRWSMDRFELLLIPVWIIVSASILSISVSQYSQLYY